EAVLRPAGQRSIEAELPALRHRLLRHARFAVNDHGLAEDLVQATLIVVVEQYARHRGDATLGTQANAILKNKIAYWYRSPTRRRMVQTRAEDTELEDSGDALFLANGVYVEPVPAWQQP